MKERLTSLRNIGMTVAVFAGAYAVTGCADYTPPSEVQQLTSQDNVDAAREKIRAEQATILAEDGLLGFHELQLVQPLREDTTTTKSEGSISGENTGLFILVVGGSHGEVEGEFSSETSTTIDRYVRLAWQANNSTKDIVVSDFPIEDIIIRDSTEATGVSLEFDLNSDSLVDLNGNWDRPECVVAGEVRGLFGDKIKKQFLVPANPGCMQTTNYDSPDEYVRKDNPDKGTVQKVYLYLDAEAKNQYLNAISSI